MALFLRLAVRIVEGDEGRKENVSRNGKKKKKNAKMGKKCYSNFYQLITLPDMVCSH